MQLLVQQIDFRVQLLLNAHAEIDWLRQEREPQQERVTFRAHLTENPGINTDKSDDRDAQVRSYSSPSLTTRINYLRSRV
jgi:hypothetical protein